jgi:hypothetical protein
LLSFYSKATLIEILVVHHPALNNPEIGLYAFEFIIDIPELTVHLESHQVKGCLEPFVQPRSSTTRKEHAVFNLTKVTVQRFEKGV